MRKVLISFAIAITFNACATPSAPAKVCTSEWITPRMDRAIDALERDAGSAVKNLSKVATIYLSGKKPSQMTLLRANNSLNILKNQLENGRGTRDLKKLASTCNDPKLLTDAFSNFMDRQEINPSIIDWIERQPIYKRIIEHLIQEVSDTPTG